MMATSVLQLSLLVLVSLSWESVSANPLFPGIPEGFGDSPTVQPETEQTSSYSPHDAYKEFIKEKNDSKNTTGGAPAVDSFHLSVIKNVVVEAQGQMTLKNFRVLPEMDSIVPGHYYSAKIDPINGIFYPAHNGIYLLSASVIIQQQESSDNTEQPPTRRRRRRNVNALPTVTVAVCINNDCTDNPALLTTGGITSTETTFTVFGTLRLQNDQNISVSILNKSSKSLTISNRSSFMAHLLTAATS